MEKLTASHTNKTFSISYGIWQLVRTAAFDREMSIKGLVEDIITGKTAPLLTGDL